MRFERNLLERVPRPVTREEALDELIPIPICSEESHMEPPVFKDPADELVNEQQITMFDHEPLRTVVRMVRRFDPLSEDAEDQYDAVVRRVNRARAGKTRLARDMNRLERQFIDGDLRVLSGPREGLPLSKSGRKRRLARLVEFGIELQQANAEEQFATGELDQMNQELDRWARETYGG